MEHRIRGYMTCLNWPGRYREGKDILPPRVNRTLQPKSCTKPGACSGLNSRLRHFCTSSTASYTRSPEQNLADSVADPESYICLRELYLLVLRGHRLGNLQRQVVAINERSASLMHPLASPI